MPRILEKLGIAALASIPAVSMLLMWEVVDVSYRAMARFVVSYLSLVFVCLTWLIVRDAWRWFNGEDEA